MEIWKTIPDFEDYQVSNLGNVKSLKFSKEKILKPTLNSYGYKTCNLSKKGIHKCYNIHQLVAMAFLNHTLCGHKLVVNHINFDKVDNRVENLEIVTQRENTNLKHIKSSSNYTGVAWSKNLKKWRSQIYINKKLIHLGYFNNEEDAYIAYKNRLDTFLLYKNI